MARWLPSPLIQAKSVTREIWLMDSNGEHARRLYGTDDDSTMTPTTCSMVAGRPANSLLQIPPNNREMGRVL